MASPRTTRRARPSHPPLWLVEGLDIVGRKRWLLALVVFGVVAIVAVASLVFPATIPATRGVGAAVGVAALLLGLAAAVASDATDLIVRGPRHVAAAGGELVAVLPRDPSVLAAGPLAAAIEEVRQPGEPLLLAMATAGRDARRTVAWTDAIGRALVTRELGVLRVDLASGRSEEPGLLEVVRDGERLADVVEFEPGVKSARLRAGRDLGAALGALSELPGRLPRDLEILLVSLPTAVNRPVVAAAAALDHVLVLVERDRTSRVDLIASLDALEAAGTDAQVVLLDTSTALRLAPPVEVDPDERPSKRSIASTVGTSPTVAPGSDGASVAVPGSSGEVAGSSGGVAGSSGGVAGSSGGVAGSSGGVAGSSGGVADEPDGVAGERVRLVESPVESAEPVEEADDAEPLLAQHNGDHGSTEAPPREIEMLEAAATAAALAIADAQQEPLADRGDGADRAGGGDGADGDTDDAVVTLAREELPQPQERPRFEAPVELIAEPQTADTTQDRGRDHRPVPVPVPDPDPGSFPHRDPGPGPIHDDANDDTDRIPRVSGLEMPSVGPTDPAAEEMIRTTAQLAMLAQDLDLREAADRDAQRAVSDVTPDTRNDAAASDASDASDASAASDDHAAGHGDDEAR